MTATLRGRATQGRSDIARRRRGAQWVTTDWPVSGAVGRRPARPAPGERPRAFPERPPHLEAGRIRSTASHLIDCHGVIKDRYKHVYENVTRQSELYIRMRQSKARYYFIIDLLNKSSTTLRAACEPLLPSPAFRIYTVMRRASGSQNERRLTVRKSRTTELVTL